jgi:hypothetical protein
MQTGELTLDEVVDRGEEIYAREIRDKVEADHRGKFLAIDVLTGSYELGEDDLTACRRLLAHHPDAKIYGLRVGYPAAYRIGGHSLRHQA